jgi:hypothetical protein
MNAHTTLETVSPTGTVAMILGGANLPLPAVLERAAESPKAAAVVPEANPEHSTQFREDMLRRYKEPFPFPWRHGGLND